MPLNYSIINGLKYLSGTTAERPANPVAGSTYYNITIGALQIYQNGAWYSFQSIVAPSAPTSVVATNSGSGRAFNNGAASVAFAPVTETGGAPSSFTVTSSPGSYTATGSSSPITVTGLQSSTQYTYTVTATNSSGTSSASSASAGVTATTVPQAPTLSASGGDSQATITITPGATGGSAITQYSIVSDPVTTSQTTANTTYTFTGLTNNTSYTFYATATNANGTSSLSSASNAIVPASNSFESIQTITVGAGGASAIEFTSIPGTYTHLQIRGVARSTRTDFSIDQLYTRVNGDSGSNYSWHWLYGNGSSAGTDKGSSTTSMNLGWFASNASASLTNAFGGVVIDILDYANTNKFKTFRVLCGNDLNGGGSPFSGTMVSASGLWRSTSAITSISFDPDNANFAQYSSFALYGIKVA